MYAASASLATVYYPFEDIANKLQEKMLARFVPKIPRVISNMPEIKIALKWAEFGLVQFPKVLTWAAPGAVFAGWMVYPALTPGFKSQLGLEDNIKPANIEYVEEEDGSTPTLA